MNSLSHRHNAHTNPMSTTQVVTSGSFQGVGVDQFILVQVIDCLGQGVIVGVSYVAGGFVDTRIVKALVVGDGNVLAAVITMMYQIF